MILGGYVGHVSSRECFVFLALSRDSASGDVYEFFRDRRIIMVSDGRTIVFNDPRLLYYPRTPRVLGNRMSGKATRQSSGTSRKFLESSRPNFTRSRRNHHFAFEFLGDDFPE